MKLKPNKMKQQWAETCRRFRLVIEHKKRMTKVKEEIKRRREEEGVYFFSIRDGFLVLQVF